MLFIREVLRRKGDHVASVHPDQSVYEMLELLEKYNIGAVPVIEDGRLVGIASERDYARRVELRSRSSKDTSVREIMTADPFVVEPSQRIRQCMQLMTDKRIRHLPVLDAGRLIGIISIGDVVKTIMDEQETRISDLESYISPAR